jgi:integrase
MAIDDPGTTEATCRHQEWMPVADFRIAPLICCECLAASTFKADLDRALSCSSCHSRHLLSPWQVLRRSGWGQTRWLVTTSRKNSSETGRHTNHLVIIGAWSFVSLARRLTMEQEHASSVVKQVRVPWNKGKLVGAKPPLRPSHVWSIRTKLQIEGKKRDLALFNLAIDSKLRGCDVVAVRVDDVAPSGYSMDRATIRQKKTGRPVRFELTDQTRQAIDEYLRLTGRKPGQFLFAGRGDRGGLTTRQYARLVQEWVASIGLDPAKFGTHSLRRTKAVLIYRRTGNLRAVQLLLGHSKIESTVRYLGIEVDDAIEIAEKIDI